MPRRSRSRFEAEETIPLKISIGNAKPEEFDLTVEYTYGPDEEVEINDAWIWDGIENRNVLWLMSEDTLDRVVDYIVETVREREAA